MIIALQTLIFFRESFITVIERFLRPYYQKLSLKFKGKEDSDDEESDDHVFAEYHDEKGVVFYPPVYSQRYAAVTDCLMDERWCGELEKVVDFGYHDMSFIKYLKDVPGIKKILGVDIESIPLRCSSDILGCDNYVTKRESPLQITLFQGNAADPDYRLIGCDAVVAIEMIEHMLPHDLERLIHTVFGFIKPWIAIFTTPNGDFNVLFKSLEKNGLRRLDHMFEWSRDQFHDWCSNIVARYPQYTVTCKGIGPGPAGTLHLGCCSQLALFVAKDYQKQPELNLNSLALVPKAPSPNNLSDMLGSWESPDTMVENNMLCVPNSVESYAELFDQRSCMTLVIASPTFSLQSMEYKDKILQCNLDSELGKNFLMFDDEIYFNVLLPSRKKYFRVYEIEDVASRLNCSTLQVNKFSKVTQNLMAKNKIDTFAHTREVVGEIRHLTKMLNFKKEHNNRDYHGIWCNINWGVNAPYWNQYYRIVREYTYPFETKTDESRILDLISEEINRLIDTEYDEEFAVDMHKLEIPIEHLMRVVANISNDTAKVKELLEWNGYEIVDDVVVHSRLMVDHISDGTQEEWQDDTISDWDTTDVRSTSLSDGSTIVPDCYGHFVRRALDQKVRKLRTLISSDDDIASELDRVVCRLMKLALRTSKGRQHPPPFSWMQCKLFDLLTLTEKVIEKRRQHFLETYPLKAIEYCNEIYKKDIIAIDQMETDALVNLKNGRIKSTGGVADISTSDILNILKHKKHKFAHTQSDRIVSKYQYLNMPDTKNDDKCNAQTLVDSEFDEYHSVTSNEFKVYDYNDQSISNVNLVDTQDVNELEKAGVFDTTKIKVPYQVIASKVGSNESFCSTSDENIQIKSKNDNGVSDKYARNSNYLIKSEKKSFRKIRSKNNFGSNNNIQKNSRTKILRRASGRRSSYYNFIKCDSIEYNKYKYKQRKNPKEHHNLQSTPPRPIPVSLIELCHSHLNIDKNMEGIKTTFSNSTKNIAATEECMFIGIVTEEGEETIAMRRHIGTAPEINLNSLDSEDPFETVINITKDNSFYKSTNETENVLSQTIFLYDLNEPSTSKGVRHLSADVQCGPDIVNCTMLSTTTSFTRIPKLFKPGVKMESANTSIQANKNTFNFSTSTELNANIQTEYKKSVGIKIKDSNTCIQEKVECFTMTQEPDDKMILTSPVFCDFDFGAETKLLKPVSSVLKIEDSGSEFCGSVGSYAKSPTRFATSSKDTSDFQIQSVSKEKNVVIKISQTSYDRPNLVCGGIHVHSFKERQVSEDVVYQGEWQRNQNIPKRNVRSPIAIKNLPTKRKKLTLKEPIYPHDIKRFTKKTTPITNPKSCSRKQDLLCKPQPIKKSYTTNSIKRNKKNIVKVASKITVNSLKSKNMKTFYATKKFVSINKDVCIKKDEGNQKFKNLKNYLPLYLKKRIESSIKKTDKNNKLQDTLEQPNNRNISNTVTEKVTKKLIEVPEKPLINNINFMIFRNETEIDNDSGNIQSQLNVGMVRKDHAIRNHSPQSQHSSTCSSPNSVATVRAVSTRNKVISNKRNSTSSDRSSSGILDTENKTTKNKKFTRRCKSTKKPQILSSVSYDNKENVPETSKNNGTSIKDAEKSAKCSFLGRTKSVFMAQMTAESSSIPLTSIAVSKTKVQNLTKPLKIANINSNNEQLIVPQSSLIMEKEISQKNSVSHNIHNKDNQDKTSPYDSENKVFIYETPNEPSANNSSTCRSAVNDDDILNKQASNHQTKSSIISAIRELIENKLKCPENSSCDSNNSDSETVILSRDDIYINSNDSLSPTSINTVITNENISQSESDLEYCYNYCPVKEANENELAPNTVEIKIPDTESDLVSLKSFASMSTSKFSEYYLADNELDITTPQVDTLNISSVQDIFERKDQNVIPNMGGVLAVQAFSGFSVNEPLAGDQPDYINFVDSETGSYAFESARQAASEEIFVSGRSSDTYESCYFDDDAYVPNWLFNIISQQQSAEESEAEEIMPLPIPIAEPAFDMNGNVLEPGVGVGAGAGDGRGMHSDHSQDSSGRGTSLSSSETSSGPQSEAVLVEPSAFTAQPEHLREAVNMDPMVGPVNRPDVSPVQVSEDHNGEDATNHQSGNVRIPINPVQVVSDIEADVSSLDTDVVDSDV